MLPISLYSSVTQSWTAGLPIHHKLVEFTQTHVHWASDAIQPSHPLSSPSPPAFNLSQHQGLFKESALCIRWPKYWRFSFNISPSNEHPWLIPLGWTGWASLQSKKCSRAFSNTTVEKHQFLGAQLSVKDRNGMNLTEAEDIKKRWQEYTEELYKKIFMTQIITMVWSLT